MPDHRVEMAFQSASHKRAACALAAFAVVILLVGGGQGAVGFAVGACFAGITGFVAYRNWVGGVAYIDERVVIRNVLATRQIPMSNVQRAVFVPGRTPFTEWGYVWIKTVDGRSYRCTSLRRSPLDGEALAGTLNDALQPHAMPGPRTKTPNA